MSANRMPKSQWADIRHRWESDPRESLTWLITELGLNVTHEAIRKRAAKEGWAKIVGLKTIVERAQRKADIRVEQVAEKLDDPTLAAQEAVDLRADIISTHRREWGEHRETYTLKTIEDDEKPAEKARVAKLTAETLKIRQEGERKAWGLDAVADNDTGGVKTLEQLDAMFAEAMSRSADMRDAVRRERGRSGGEAAG